MNHYGYSRTTWDINIHAQDTPENRKSIVDALEYVGYGKMDALLRVPMLAGYCEIMMDDGMYVDLISHIPRLDPADFEAQHDRKSVAEVDCVQIPIVSYRGLMINKEKTGRTKDQYDYEQLAKIRRD